MTIPALPSGLYPEDYDRIEAAVMETARGRWFLLEYARRQRAAETALLTQAVERLERRMAAADEMRAARVSMPIEQAASVAAPLDAGRRAQHISERLQDFAWSLRERGLDERVCAEIEDLARKAIEFAEPPAPLAESRAEGEERDEIWPETPAPSGHSAPAERRQVEEKADASTHALERAALAPALPRFAGEAIERPAAGADSLTHDIIPAEASRSRERSTLPVDPRLIALSRLDHLSIAEKLALFA